MSKEAQKTFSSVEDIPDDYLVRKGKIPVEFQPDSLDQYFEPLEEFPKQYIPPGVEIRAGD